MKSGKNIFYRKFIYLMLNKPQGYLSATEDDHDPVVVDLLPEELKHFAPFPVGRLDKDTEGLLLLTNDGEFANKLMHPGHEVNKTYEVSVKGYHEAAPALLRRPIELDGYRIREPQVKLVRASGDKAKFLVTIHEGRNRQVRRMCDAAGMTVLTLRRISEGNLQLGRLPLGKWRHLTREELAGLK